MIASIPDSPTDRVVTIIDEGDAPIINPGRATTKSESPELGLSVYDVPRITPERAFAQPNSAQDAIENSQPPQVVPNSSPTLPTTPEMNGQLEVQESAVQRKEKSPLHACRSLSRKAPTVNGSPAGHTKLANGGDRDSEQIYDDIESDTESFHERQQMHIAKRFRSDRTTPGRLHGPRAPKILTKEKRNGPFLIPEFPASRLNNRVQGYLGEPTNAQQQPEATISDHVEANPTLEFRDDGSNVEMHQVPETVDPPTDNGGTNLEPLLQSDAAVDDVNLQRSAKSLAEVATSASTASYGHSKNWSNLDINDPKKQALSQGRNPPFSPLENSEASGDDESDSDIVQDQEVEAAETRAVSGKESNHHRQSSLEDTKGQDDLGMQKEADQSAETEGADVIEGTVQDGISSDAGSQDSISDPEQPQETAGRDSPTSDGASGSCYSENENTSASNPLPKGNQKNEVKHPPPRQTAIQASEKISSQNAENAKILQQQKREKKKASMSSTSHAIATKIPGSTKATPSTEEQKSRQVEKKAPKRAKQAATLRTKQKQAEQAKSPNLRVGLRDGWATQLFQSVGEEAPTNNNQIHTDSEDERQAEKSVRAESVNQTVKMPKLASDGPVNRSRPPSEAGSSAKKRRSITPAIPNGYITKSPSTKSRLMSSSPLASRTSVSSENPLRSALKQYQSSSTLRRSVSFAEEKDGHPHTEAKAFSKSPIAQPQQISPLVALHNRLALETTPSVPSSSSRNSYVGNVRSKPVNGLTAKKGMLQQKLDVTRDKKSKGRAVEGPASPPRSNSKQDDKSNSSEEDSIPQSLSDANSANGNAKAGPSSQKRSSQESNPKPNLRVKEHPTGMPIDPAIEELSSRSSTKSTSIPGSKSDQARSMSRSPALKMSETASVSSGESGSDESDSQSGSEEASSSGSQSEGSASNSRSPSPEEDGTKIHVGTVGQTLKGAQRKSKSATPIVVAEARRADEGADQLIERKTPTGTTKPKTAANGHTSETSQYTFRYPTLAMQRKVAKAKTAEEEASLLASSQKSSKRPVQEDATSSSSEEESSSESAGDDEDDDGVAVSPAISQKISQPKSSQFSRLRGVLKSQHLPLMLLPLVAC